MLRSTSSVPICVRDTAKTVAEVSVMTTAGKQQKTDCRFYACFNNQGPDFKKNLRTNLGQT